MTDHPHCYGYAEGPGSDGQGRILDNGEHEACNATVKRFRKRRELHGPDQVPMNALMHWAFH
ncbi:MAG: hypothetical protein ACOH13_00485 [Flavobacteriales bacterium]